MKCLGGIIFLALAVPGALGSVEVSVPEQLDVEVGQPVRIPCTHTITGSKSNVMVEWFIINKLGERQRIAFKDATSSVTDPDTGYSDRATMDSDYTLSISQAELMDERSFLCQVIAGAAGSQEGKTELKVYDAPEQPEVEYNRASLSVTEQHPSEIGTCTSRNGYPVPSIVWYKDGVSLPTVTNHNNKMYMTPRVVKEASGLYTATNKLYLKLSKADKDSRYHCQVHFQMMNGRKHTLDSEDFQISLYYHTEVVTFKLISAAMIKEGDDVTLQCSADGFPQPDYTFYKLEDGEEVDLRTNKDGILRLKNITKQQSGKYQCEALDFDAPPEVELKKDLSIHVNYLDPLVLNRKGPITVHRGEDVQVSCITQGSATPKITWRKGEEQLSHSGTLKLEKVSYKSSGTYVCEASVPSIHGLMKTQKLEVVVEGKPSLHNNPSKVTVEKEGDSVTLTCTASGHPKPKITWNVEKQQLQTSSDNAVTSKVSLPVTSEMVQSGVMCNATNKYGSAQWSFHLAIVPPTTAPPMTSGENHELQGGGGGAVIAVVVCVLLLLLVVAILYCLHKKGKLPCGKPGKKDTVKLESEDQCLGGKIDKDNDDDDEESGRWKRRC
ncbi:basal cell adhesion molecule-like isoform X2 [Carcharodon carcharias]|uniref:basal cell adhesion molecule-like isoform X2 n=1 Tax=Carcharodon carcharias TaxID=13397 RepID=UPI001B7E82D5|nr:basal cell adhesion molecule-like isoform X2 [Carcharodon carcharias]